MALEKARIPVGHIYKPSETLRDPHVRHGGFFKEINYPGAAALALAKEKDSATFRNSFGYLRKAPETASYRNYYLYYGAQAFFHASPAEWAKWNRKNITTLKQNSMLVKTVKLNVIFNVYMIGIKKMIWRFVLYVLNQIELML